MIEKIPEADSAIKSSVYQSLPKKLAYLDHFAHDASFFDPQTFPVSLSVPILSLRQWIGYHRLWPVSLLPRHPQ